MVQAVKIRITREIEAPPNIGKKIKQARIADGRSVQILATLAGISSAYWYQIEQEKMAAVSGEHFRGIQNALGVDFGVNFEEVDHD